MVSRLIRSWPLVIQPMMWKCWQESAFLLWLWAMGPKRSRMSLPYVTVSNNEDGIYQGRDHFGLMEEASDVSE